jgi:hypothetical protein
MNQTTVSLPENVYEQLGGDEEAVAAVLSKLAAEHAQLQESIGNHSHLLNSTSSFSDRCGTKNS